MTRALALVGILVLSGCYAYLPERPGDIAPGSDVRVHLSREGVEWIGAAYGSGTGVLEGRLDSWGDTVVVTVPVRASPGMLDRDLRNTIKVRQSDVLSVDLRRRDQTKSILASVGFGTVVALTAVAMFGGVFGGTQPTPEQLPDDGIRIPLSPQLIP
jgi:hypothetical protein